MKQRKLTDYFLMSVVTTLIVFPVMAGNIQGENDAAARCEKSREALIAPEREQLISKCVAQNKGVTYCENYYRDYGSGGTGAGGKYQTRKFNNIADCQTAKKELKANRHSSQGVSKGRNADNITTRSSGSDSTNRDTNEANSGRDGSAPSSR